MRSRHLAVLALVLTALGSGLFLYKWRVLGFPLRAEEETSIWTVQARVSFRPGEGPVKVRLEVPTGAPGFSLLDENFVSRGYGLRTSQDGDHRAVQWAIRRAQGPQNLYYRALVYQDPARDDLLEAPEYPEVPALEEPHASALETLINEVRGHSADIPSFTAELISRVQAEQPLAEADLLLEDAVSPAERAHRIAMLLAGARIPARVAYGLELKDQVSRAGFQPWLEVWDGEDWLYFDPVSGEQRLPESFLLWWRSGVAGAEREDMLGRNDALQVEGARGRAELRLSVQRDVTGSMEVAERRAELLRSRVVQFSLLDLPVDAQAVYAITVMIPIGALIMVLLRNLVGIKTFGTFMPVLVALAFRETRLLWGVVLFVLVVTLGLSIRFYLERLHLLLVPRLAAGLTVVVLLISTMSILSHRLGLERGLSVALFPLVILTMAIERLSVVWEERGPAEAIQEATGSLAVAALAYVVMSWGLLEHLFFVFPELLLVVLAVILVLGRYRGYRLLELRRFRALAERMER